MAVHRLTIQSLWGHQRRWVTLFFAFLVGSIAVLGYWLVAGPFSFLSDEERGAAASVFDPRILNPNDPSQPLLLGGRLVGLEQAKDITGIPVLRPRHPLASDASLYQVWISTSETPEVALRYSTGVRVYLSVWPPGSVPATFYQTQVAESGVGEFQMISGNPAWVVAANAQAPSWPPNAVVDVSIGNIEVILQGNVSVEDLVAVAETVG